MNILPNNYLELTIILPEPHSRSIPIRIHINNIAQLQKVKERNITRHYIHCFYAAHIKNQLEPYFPKYKWAQIGYTHTVTLETSETDFNQFPKILGPNCLRPFLYVGPTHRRDYTYPHNTQYL